VEVAYQCHSEMVRVLIDKFEASAACVDTWAPIHAVAGSGLSGSEVDRCKIMALSLTCGANIDVADPYRRTALHFATI
jgi:hypothetical protein